MTLGPKYSGQKSTCLTLSNNVAGNIVSKSQVAGDGNEQVDAAGAANTGQNDRCRFHRAVVIDFVEDRKHLAE